MMKNALASVVAISAIVATSVFAVQENETGASTLKAAVAKFNQETQSHPIGKNQLPLTEDEVVAAIRGWIPAHTPGVTDEIYNAFQAVAESRELPENADLSFCPGWTGYRGYAFQVWWVDLTIMTSEKSESGYTFRIRDQKISSRKMTADELAELAEFADLADREKRQSELQRDK